MSDDIELQTYVGIPVKIGEKFLGSLCVVYQNIFSPTPQELEILTFIAQAVAIEDERRVAVQALRESIEWHRDLITTTSDIFWQTDEQGDFVYVGPQVEKILGYKPDELIGRKPSDFLEPSSVANMQKAFRSAVTNPQNLVSLDSLWRHKDGHQVVLESRALPVFRPDRSIAGFRGIDRDVTERKRAEEALRESGEKFRSIFDMVNDAIHIHEIGPDGEPGKFIEINEVACRMLQYTREELLAHGPLDFVTGYHSRPLEAITQGIIIERPLNLRDRAPEKGRDDNPGRDQCSRCQFPGETCDNLGGPGHHRTQAGRRSTP